MQFERRAALVPGSKLPSPEEAQLILHQREFSEPPTPLRVDTGQVQANSPPSKSNHKNGLALHIPQARHHQQVEHFLPLAEKLHLRLSTTELATSHPPQEPRPRSTFRLPSRGPQPRPDHKASAQVRLDHKRKHAYYSQDEQRQYRPLLSEDILHMSEVASEDGIKASGRDIFGERGTCSVFDQVPPPLPKIPLKSVLRMHLHNIY